MKEDSEFKFYGVSYFSDGGIVADLLTEDEAIKFLRLDIDGPSNPSNTLKYYRDKGLLRPTKVGHKNCYLKTELIRFLNNKTYSPN